MEFVESLILDGNVLETICGNIMHMNLWKNLPAAGAKKIDTFRALLRGKRFKNRDFFGACGGLNLQKTICGNIMQMNLWKEFVESHVQKEFVESPTFESKRAKKWQLWKPLRGG